MRNVLKKIENLFSKQSSRVVFKDALGEILPRKDNWISFLIISTVAAIPAGIIGFSKDTVELFYKAVGNLNTIILALFAIVFTGYTLFQALINQDLLKRLIFADAKTANKKKKTEDTTPDNEPVCKSKLQESNEYFVSIMMLDVLAIMINALLMLLVGSLPKDFFFPFCNTINNIMAAISIWVYFIFMIFIIWEMKSFVFNMFQLFNASAGSKALEILKNENEEKWDK